MLHYKLKYFKDKTTHLKRNLLSFEFLNFIYLFFLKSENNLSIYIYEALEVLDMTMMSELLKPLHNP